MEVRVWSRLQVDRIDGVRGGVCATSAPPPMIIARWSWIGGSMTVADCPDGRARARCEPLSGHESSGEKIIGPATAALAERVSSGEEHLAVFEQEVVRVQRPALTRLAPRVREGVSDSCVLVNVRVTGEKISVSGLFWGAVGCSSPSPRGQHAPIAECGSVGYQLPAAMSPACSYFTFQDRMCTPYSTLEVHLPWVRPGVLVRHVLRAPGSGATGHQQPSVRQERLTGAEEVPRPVLDRREPVGFFAGIPDDRPHLLVRSGAGM